MQAGYLNLSLNFFLTLNYLVATLKTKKKPVTLILIMFYLA